MGGGRAASHHNIVGHVDYDLPWAARATSFGSHGPHSSTTAGCNPLPACLQEEAAVDGSGRGCRGAQSIVEGCGGLWRAVEGCGGVWRVVEGCGGLWRVVDGGRNGARTAMAVSIAARPSPRLEPGHGGLLMVGGCREW